MYVYSSDTPNMVTKDEDSALIAAQMAEYEKKHGPVETSPIRPVEVQRKRSRKEVKEAMARKDYLKGQSRKRGRKKG
jgi:hypothetical protein